MKSTMANGSSSDVYKFTFSPEDNTKFVQKLWTIREKNKGEVDEVVDETESITNLVINKTDSGWEMIAKPKKTTIKRNGQLVNNPITDLISKIEYVYELNPNGSIVDVSGIDRFIEGLSKQFPEPIFKQLSSVFNAEALKEKEINEWNARIGEYIGAEVKVGDEFNNESPFQLPNGSVIHYIINTRIDAVEKCGSTDCIRIKQSYDSRVDNESGVPLLGNKKSTGPDSGFPLPEANMESVSGFVDRLIDPATMLIYQEENQRVLRMNIDIPGKGTVLTEATDTRKYEFVY